MTPAPQDWWCPCKTQFQKEAHEMEEERQRKLREELRHAKTSGEVEQEKVQPSKQKKERGQG